MINKIKSGLLVIIVQIVLCAIAFPYFFKSGFQASFSNDYDGMKNNYTLAQYVEEPIGEKGIFYFQFMNYPQGEYVFTADNTPLISIPLRFIHHYVYPIGPHASAIYNIFILLSFVMGAVLLYFLVNRFLSNRLLSVAFAVVIPWTLPQLLKLNGHYNLSLFGIFVGATLLCMLLQRHWARIGKRYTYFIGLIVITVGSFLIHGYYLPILAAFIGVYLLGLSIYQAYISKKWIVLLLPFLYVGIVGALAFFILKYTDGYYALRDNVALGYDITEYKLSPSFLYKSYSFQSFKFFLDSTYSSAYFESHQYLGNLGWYGLCLLLFIGIVSAKYRLVMFQLNYRLWANAIFRNVFIAGITVFLIAFGERFSNIRDKVILQWPINVDAGGMGTWVFYIIVFLVIYMLYIMLTQYKLQQKSYKLIIDWRLIVLWLLIILAALSMFSNILSIGGNLNVLNPLYFIHQVSGIVEHFRAISRFAWPFYIIFYCWLVYILYHIIRLMPRRISMSLSIILSLITVIQAADYIYDANRGKNHKNLLSVATKNAAVLDIIGHCDAILPLPFFYVGAEDLSLTLDDDNAWSRQMYILSYHSKVPLVAAKLSRLSIVVGKQKLSMFATGEVEPGLSGKRVVVARNDALMTPENIEKRSALYSNEHIQLLIKNQRDFHISKGMKLLGVKDGISYYEWIVQ